MKQKSIRVIEVNSLEELKKIAKKLPLFKDNYFLLNEKNEEIEKFLKSLNLKYFIVNKEVTIKEIKITKTPFQKEANPISQKVKIYDRIIRSGEEIISDKHLIFTKRINEGAKIETSSNIEIFDENAGLIICNGEFVIVKKNKGTIIFNGEELEKTDKLTLFTERGKKVLEWNKEQ